MRKFSDTDLAISARDERERRVSAYPDIVRRGGMSGADAEREIGWVGAIATTLTTGRVPDGYLLDDLYRAAEREAKMREAYYWPRIRAGQANRLDGIRRIDEMKAVRDRIYSMMQPSLVSIDGGGAG